MLLKDATKQQEVKIVLLNKSQVLEELLEEDSFNEMAGLISHSHQHVRKFWVLKSNTTENGSQLRPSRRSRRDKEKKQKSTKVVHEQE